MIRSGVRRRSGFDAVISQIADYVAHYQIEARSRARRRITCLLDSVGCACAALANPQCASMLGPLVAGSVVPHGARVPGTPFVLDPVEATFNTGALIRWLDYNDTFYGATWCTRRTHLQPYFA
jgi:2-methylcitrate dehydratase